MSAPGGCTNWNCRYERPRLLARIAELERLLGPDYHVFESRGDDGWSLRHPASCRDELLDCPLHAVALALEAPPVGQGRYRVELDAGELVFGELDPANEGGTR